MHGHVNTSVQIDGASYSEELILQQHRCQKINSHISYNMCKYVTMYDYIKFDVPNSKY